MTTEENRKRLIKLWYSARIQKSFQMDFHYEGNSAVFTLPYNPNFDHALNGIHGGAIATMIDNAGWFTAAPLYDSWIATVEFQVRLLEHVSETDLVAKGEIIRSGKRLTVTEMTVTDASNRVIAVGSGTFAATGVPIEID